MTPVQRRLALALGTTQTLSWATTFYVPATMTAAAATSLGASPTLLLGAFSWSLLVSALCAPRIGRYIDRHGGRPILAGGAIVTAAGLALLAAAQSVAHWYLAWTVLGVGMALGLYDTAFATIGRLLGREARPAIVGVTLMGGFAGSIGWPTGTWLAHHLGWREGVLIYALVQIAVILPVALAFVPRPAAETGPAATGAPARTAAGEPAAAGSRGAFLLIGAFFTSRSAIGAAISVHALVLLQGLGLSVDAAVATAALIGPAQVGIRVLEYRFARTLSPVTTARLGAALLPLGVAATLLGAPAAVFALAYGMSNGVFTISRGTLPMHIFGPVGYATRVGQLALPSLLAQAAAPTLLAPLVLALPASWIFAGLGALSLAGFACLLPLRR